MKTGSDHIFHLNAEWRRAIMMEAKRREFGSLLYFCEVWFPCMMRLGAFPIRDNV